MEQPEILVGVLIAMVVILAWFWYKQHDSAVKPDSYYVGVEMDQKPPRVISDDQLCEQLSGVRPWRTEEVEPLILGGMYSAVRPMRDVYSERMSHDDKQGMVEYSSSGLPGDVGVDVGPNEKPSYDDGLPEAWNFPTTPMQTYRSKSVDYYDTSLGQSVPFTEGMYSLIEPDHDPLM